MIASKHTSWFRFKLGQPDKKKSCSDTHRGNLGKDKRVNLSDRVKLEVWDMGLNNSTLLPEGSCSIY